MKPIKILQLIPPFGLGGIHTYIFNHYKYMDQEKFRFTFMTQSLDVQKAEEFRDFSFDVKLLSTTAAKNPDLFTKRVREILMEGYDVLHLHNSYWTGFLIEEIAKKVGIPKVIVHSHSTFIDIDESEKRKAHFERHEKLKRAFSPDLATDLCACSWKAADWLFGPQIPRDKIRIMKNAIEVERFQFNPEARRRIRTELGLENSWVLGTVGRIAYQKNHKFMIDVFQEFHKAYNNTKLMIVGDGELRKELENQIQKSGLEDDVLLLGWKPDVENYLQAIDCFLLPSRFEGNPVSLVEAAASGLPAIIADTITEEAVIGDTIHQVPLRVSSWVSALDQVAGKCINRIDGAETVRNAGYDVKRQAKVLERLYKQL